MRHPPAPMCGNCGSLEWDTPGGERAGHGVLSGSCRATRTRPTTSRASWCWSSSTRACALVSNLVDVRRRPYVPYDDLTVVGRLSTSTTVCCCPVFHPAGRRRDRRHDRRRHRPDRVLEGVGPQRAAARGRGVAGRDPRRRPHAGRHRRHGHVHRRHATTSSSSCATSASRSSATGRARPTAAPARTPPCSTRRPRSRVGRGERRARVPRVQRAVGSALRPTERRGHGAAGSNWYLPFGLDTPAKIYSLWFQRYMHELRRDQRRLRPLHGRRPPVTPPPTRTRGSTSGRSRSTTTRSRAGSSSRCCACSTAARRATAASRSSSPPPTGRATCRNRAVRIVAARRRAPRSTASVMFNYYHADLAVFPEARVPRPPAVRAIAGSGPTTSTWR